MGKTGSAYSLKVSSDALRAFASMDKKWSDICSLSAGDIEPDMVECSGYHKLTPDDLRNVAFRCIETDIRAGDFMFEWWEPLHLFFTDCLGINDLFREVTGDPAGVFTLKALPETDEEITLWALMEFGNVRKAFADSPHMVTHPLSEIVSLEDIIKMIDWHEEDMGLAPAVRRYVDPVKEGFIAEYDNDLILRDCDTLTRDIFRAFTDELVEKDNLLALKIKGYACYGGNSIYQCDFETAAECLERLWRVGGIGYAANTLGYMHYHGELSKGVPDYRTAFFYYSAASQFGVTESKLMLSRMLYNGNYVEPNPVMAYSILEQLYYHEKDRFEDEDPDSRLAEVAYEMAEVERLGRNPYFKDYMGYKSRRYLLQAGFAYARNPLSPILKGKIDRALTSGVNIFREYKKSYSSELPDPLMEFVNDAGYGNYLLTYRAMKSGKLRITVQRLATPDKKPDKSLLTYINFGCCSLTDSLVFTASEADLQTLPGKDGEGFVFDGVDSNKGSLFFLFNGAPIAKLTAKKYTITRPD